MKVWTLLKQVYDWNKVDLWFTIGLCLVSSFLLHLLKLDAPLQAMLVIFLLVKVFYFMSSASVLPTIGSDLNQFSWKYLQSLPLSKPHLLAFLSLSSLFNMLPFTVWFFSFEKILLIEVLDFESVSFGQSLKIFFTLLPLFLTLGVMSVLGTIQFPRQQYIKRNERVLLFNNIRRIVFAAALFVYLVLTLIYLERTYHVDMAAKSVRLLKGSWNLLGGWWFPVMAMSFLGIKYWRTLKIWQDEKLSYQKISWRPQKDIPLFTLSLIMLIAPFQLNIFDTPYFLDTHGFLRAIHRNDQEKIALYLKDQASLGIKNKFGFTPLHAAAFAGNLKLLKQLEEGGLSRDGIVQLEGQNQINGHDLLMLAMSERHESIATYLLETGHNIKSQDGKLMQLAASKCLPKVTDQLIKRGIDISAKSANGMTGMHLAAKANCFSVVISLQEAGLDPLIKDQEGKIALDYAGKYSRDLAYYLEKKSRAPASTK